MAARSRALGIIVGVAADALLGDPRRFHPVAGFGSVAGLLEKRVYADSRARGILYTTLLVGGAAAAGWAVDRTARGTVTNMLATAAVTWTVVGSRMLASEGDAIAAALETGDLAAARRRLPNLVGRDPSQLDAAEIARAATESIAENTSDAVVAPLLIGALAGIPGLMAYRAINTLDAMVGHRSERYRRFGWASARLDDVANLLPARCTAAIVAALSPDPTRTWRVTRRFARQHPSPNSGWCEAAYAAALGLRLGGRNIYDGRAEVRPTLGVGRPPAAADLRAASRLLRQVTVAAAIGAAALAVGRAAVARLVP